MYFQIIKYIKTWVVAVRSRWCILGFCVLGIFLFSIKIAYINVTIYKKNGNKTKAFSRSIY